METRFAVVTVNGVETDRLPSVAVIVAVPGAFVETNPLEPASLLTDATLAALEVQVTAADTSCTELSV